MKARLPALALTILWSTAAWAAKSVTAPGVKEASESFASRPLILIIALGALGLVPFVLLMVTSFVKISVVLSIVRSALGTQQIPPTQVITGLAIILTFYIMAPTGQAMYRAAEPDQFKNADGLLSSKTVDQLKEASIKAREP